MSKTLDNLTDDRLSELLALEARVKDDALALAQRDAENARLRGALERIASSGGQELFPSHAFIRSLIPRSEMWLTRRIRAANCNCPHCGVRAVRLPTGRSQ